MAEIMKIAPRFKHNALAMLVLLALTIPAVALAENPPLNLLSNPGFEPGSASGSSSFTGRGPGPAAAAGWETFNNTLGTTTTELLPSAVPGNFIFHVTTNGQGNGLANAFMPSGTGPMQGVSLVWIFVVRGEVGIGTGNGGATGFNAFSQTTGAWEILAGIHEGSSVNEFIAYASSVGGAEFYLHNPNVFAVESIGGAPGAISTLRSGGACDGVFSGTFTGDLTVATGQNCIFVDGTITGNVQQSGGNLLLAGDLVGGNVQIDGGTFSIGPLMSINGNLQAHNLASRWALDQICDSIVHADLQVHNSNAGVQIGSGHPSSCAGNVVRGNLQVDNNAGLTSIVENAVGGNLLVDNNAGPTQVIGNAVKRQLHCQNNRAIRQGLNAAQAMQGQCVWR